jgi:RHS repeat-associated protein
MAEPHSSHNAENHGCVLFAPLRLKSGWQVFLAVTVGLITPGWSFGQAAGSLPSPSPFNYTRTSGFGYDAATGLLTNETIEPTIVSVCASTDYTPDPYGNRASSSTHNCTGATGDAVFATRTTTVSYTNSAAQAGIVNGQYPYTTTSVLPTHNITSTRQFDVRFGSVTSETLVSSPGSVTTTTTYDGFGRKTSESRPDGTLTQWIYEYCAGFDPNVVGGGTVACPTVAAGTSNVNLVTRVTQKPLGVNGAQNGPSTIVYQDPLGRDVRTQTESALSATQWVVTWVVYDQQGRVAQKSEPYFDSDPAAVALSSSTLVWTTTQYDLLGRPTSIQRPDPTATTTAGVATTTIAYTDLRVATTTPPTVNNPQGQTTTQVRDSQGHVIEVIDAIGSVLVRQYDAFGNLVATFDQYGNSVTAAFDLRGRKYQTNDPDMGQWTYGYDALGEMVWQQSPNERAAGQKTSFTFDALGRMATRVAPEFTTTWSYDTYAGGAACAYGTLKLCEVANTALDASEVMDRKYTYDSGGRPLTNTFSAPSGPTFVSSVAYDPASGRVASQTYPSGLQVSYGYSATGYLNLITNAGAMLWSVSSGGVNARGQIEHQVYANGVQTDQQFDPQTGRLQTIKAQLSTQAPGALVNLGFGWDPLSNLMSRSDANGDGTNVAATDTFGYDSLNRLTTDVVASAAIAGGSRTVTMTYNEIGNILSKSDVAGAYAYGASGSASSLPHAVAQVGATTYQYDANGNVISASGGLWQGVTYTSFNLPNDSATGGLTGPNGVRYKWRYGPSLERVREDRVSATGTRTTWFQHPDNAGGLSFERETAENGSVTNRHYITAGGRVIAVLTTTAAAPTTVAQTDYWHVDQIGSLVAVTGGAGNLVERYAYDPFGKRRFADGNFDATNALYIDATHYVDQSATLALLTSTRGTVRGFTGHEHLDDLGLIHMNGRMYDATIARFMQADPTIQYSLLMQDYNRYSYLMNNPLAGFDPSGYHFLGDFGEFIDDALGMLLGWAPPWLRDIAAIVVSYELGPEAGEGFWAAAADTALAGFSAGVITSGSLEGGLQQAISAELFFGAGQLATAEQFGETSLGRAVFHAGAGCLSSVMQGGNCGKGAVGAGLTQYLGSNFAAWAKGEVPNVKLRIVVQVIGFSVIGGTASKLTGGKFGNGATSGAFQYLFNCRITEDGCINPAGDMTDTVTPDGNNPVAEWFYNNVSLDVGADAGFGAGLSGSADFNFKEGTTSVLLGQVYGVDAGGGVNVQLTGPGLENGFYGATKVCLGAGVGGCFEIDFQYGHVSTSVTAGANAGFSFMSGPGYHATLYGHTPASPPPYSGGG